VGKRDSRVVGANLGQEELKRKSVKKREHRARGKVGWELNQPSEDQQKQSGEGKGDSVISKGTPGSESHG